MYSWFGPAWWLSGKESTYQCRRAGFWPWVRKILWRKKWQPTPVFLPGKSHGPRKLVGYCPWGHKRAGHDWETKQQQQQQNLWFSYRPHLWKLPTSSALSQDSPQPCCPRVPSFSPLPFWSLSPPPFPLQNSLGPSKLLSPDLHTPTGCLVLLQVCQKPLIPKMNILFVPHKQKIPQLSGLLCLEDSMNCKWLFFLLSHVHIQNKEFTMCVKESTHSFSLFF